MATLLTLWSAIQAVVASDFRVHVKGTVQIRSAEFRPDEGGCYKAAVVGTEEKATNIRLIVTDTAEEKELIKGEQTIDFTGFLVFLKGTRRVAIYTAKSLIKEYTTPSEPPNLGVLFTTFVGRIERRLYKSINATMGVARWNLGLFTDDAEPCYMVAWVSFLHLSITLLTHRPQCFPCRSSWSYFHGREWLPSRNTCPLHRAVRTHRSRNSQGPQDIITRLPSYIRYRCSRSPSPHRSRKSWPRPRSHRRTGSQTTIVHPRHQAEVSFG